MSIPVGLRQRGWAKGPSGVALLLLLLGSASCTTDRPKERFDRRPSSSPQAGSGTGGPSRDAGTGALPGSGLGMGQCGPAPALTGDFTRERLRSAAAGCAMWHYCEFEGVAATLRSAVEAYAAQPGDETLGTAQQAWAQAMLAWSRIELFQFGPLAPSQPSEGKDIYQGRNLRDRIYAWPAISACRVEEQVVTERYVQNMEGVFPSARGLFALEYLLFAPDPQSPCAAGSATAQTRAALEAEAFSARKASYAVALAKDVEQWAQSLRTAWSPDGENFEQVFVSASGYPDEQEAMNVLAWSLIYIEREVKDWKLGIPAGQTMTARVTSPETPYAQLGTEAMRANLSGFRSVWQGCGEAGEGLGFDDWLEAAGHAELATDLAAALQASEAALAALPPLHQASTEQVAAAHSVLRELTTLLKGDLFGAGSPLNLKTPASVEGDTD